MGVYLPNIEMPKTCHCCIMCVQVSDGDIDWHWECCLLCEKVARYATDRIPGCPLVPVPPHGRLIDADALEYGEAYLNGHYELGDFEIVTREDIESAPTIIPAEEGEI